jgi:hypothetical protein
MKKTPRALYDSEYKIIPADQQEEIEEDIFDTYMENLLPTKASDPYREYSEGPRLLRKPDNVFKWWDNQTDYPDLCQMAFDLLLYQLCRLRLNESLVRPSTLFWTLAAA